jgi:hypothetical protein
MRCSTESLETQIENMTPLEMHKKMFPHVNLNFYQMDLLEVEIKDEGAWKETLKFWASNDYRGQSVGKMIDYYNSVIDKRNQARWQDVGRYDGEITETKCTTCHDLKRIWQFPKSGSIEGAVEVNCPDCVLQTA